MTDSVKLWESAARLLCSEFAPFMEWLRGERERVIERLVAAPESQIGRLQGDAQRLKMILDLIEGARSSLDKKSGR